MDKPKIVSVTGLDPDQKERDGLDVPELPGGEPPARKPDVFSSPQPPPVFKSPAPQTQNEPVPAVEPLPKPVPPAAEPSLSSPRLVEFKSEVPPERVAEQEEFKPTEPELNDAPEIPPERLKPLSVPLEPPVAVLPPAPVVPSSQAARSEPVQAPPWVARNESRPNVFSRPEFDDREDDALAEELFKDSKPRIVARRDVVQEYREQASRDILPPQNPPQPLTMDEQRAHAKGLAQKIHEEKQTEGFFSKIRRRLGWR